MKSNAFFATFTIILLKKIVIGQHNGLACNKNFEINGPIPQQPSTQTIVNNVQKLLYPKEIIEQLPNNVNQHQIRLLTNAPLPSPITQQIQLPPDLQQQPLQVQQYLQLQQSHPIQPLQLQSNIPLQPPLQSQPLLLSQQLQPQSLLQPQQSLPLQSQTPAYPAIQLQDSLQFQPHMQIQSQQNLQLQQQLQSQDILQPKFTSLAFDQVKTPHQQPLQAPIPIILRPSVDQQEVLQAPLLPQQSFGFQQNFPQKALTVSESNSLVDIPLARQGSNNQPNSQIQVKWKSFNPQAVVNVENLHNIQNRNVHLQRNSIEPVNTVTNTQSSSYRTKEASLPGNSLKYYVASLQPPCPSQSSTSSSTVSNSQSFTITPSNYIKPAEEKYGSVIAPFNYIADIQTAIPETTKSVNSISPSPTVLAVTSSPIHSTNTQTSYQQVTDTSQNAYFNPNPGLFYPERSQISVSQPTALVTNPPSMVSSVPISVVQTPSITSQYGVSSAYPVIAPAYVSQKPKSTNLKSLLPLIFNLLREKITSCSCGNNCPCECKNKSSDNKVEVASGYSNLNHYGTIQNSFSALNPVADDTEGNECLRERKNSEKIEKVSAEVSGESLEEEEESDEEEMDEDEDD